MNKKTNVWRQTASTSRCGLLNDIWMQTFIWNQPDTKSTVASPTWSELSVVILTFVDLSTQTPTISCSHMQFRHLICQLATDHTRVVAVKSHTFCGDTYLAHSTRMWALSHYNFYRLLSICLYTWRQCNNLSQ